MTRSVLRMARRFGITGTSEIFRAFILAADPGSAVSLRGAAPCAGVFGVSFGST